MARIVDRAERRRRFPVSDMTWDRWEAAGIAPRRVQLSAARVGWIDEELDAFALSLPRGPLTQRTQRARAEALTPEAQAKRAETLAAQKAAA